MLPNWKRTVRRYVVSPSKVRCEVTSLVDWCNSRNGGQLVSSRCVAGVCTDPSGHKPMWALLTRLRRLASRDFAGAAFVMLDKTYPGWLAGESMVQLKGSGLVVTSWVKQGCTMMSRSRWGAGRDNGSLQ